MSLTKPMMGRLLGVVWVCALSWWGSGEAKGAESEEKPSRPNVIVLVADDLRWDFLGCAGHRVVQTPHLDRLAARGAFFENSFVVDAICPCSRASLLTGQHVRRHGVTDFARGISPEAWERTYPGLLRRQGYRTGFIGKFGVGTEMPSAEFDYWRGFGGQGNYFEKGMGEHLTARMGAQAEEFLREGRGKRPFCLSVSFKAPHSQNEQPGEEYPVDERDRELYEGMQIGQPETFGERFFRALPEFVQKSEGRLRFERRGYERREVYEEGLRNYARLVTGMDREIGRIVKVLEEIGELERTVIVFTSDNGYFLGGRGLVDKFLMYEESIRVPMIVFDGRRKEAGGIRRREMVLNIDVGPTVLEYAGIVIPAEMQGQSMVRLMNRGGEKADVEWRTEWFYEHVYQHTGTIPQCSGLRTERWKYVRYPDQTPVVEQLFDLENDRLEEHDQSAEMENVLLMMDLRRRWEEHDRNVR